MKHLSRVKKPINIFVILIIGFFTSNCAYSTSIIPTKSILGKVIVINKEIQEDKLSNSITLKGTVRNISKQPYRKFDVEWKILDKDNKLYKIKYDNKENWSAYFFYIAHLGSKAETNFEITIDLSNNHMSLSNATLIKESISNNRYEIDIIASMYE